MRTLFVIAPAVLFLYAFRRFACGGCALNTSMTPYLTFKACFMCFLYILPQLHKNVLKRILQRSVRIGLVLAIPQLFPVCSRVISGRLCYWFSVWLWLARSCRAAGLLWVPGGGLFLIGWRFPGWCREGREYQENV